MVPDEGVSLFCPHCGKHTSVTPTPLFIIADHGYGSRTQRSLSESLKQAPYYLQPNGAVWWMGKCNACQEPVLVRDRGTVVLPPPGPGPVAEEIPEPMKSDLREAKRCFAVGAFNAAVVMARRALQCATVEQGAPSGQLWQQIKWLDDNRKITSQQREWADAARWVGNHGAHDTEPNVSAGQPAISSVTKDDAEDTINLVEHLFETLYVASAVAAKQLAKRGKSAQGTKAKS